MRRINIPFLLVVIVTFYLSYSLTAQQTESSSPDSSTFQNMELEGLLKLQSTGISSELEKQINDKLTVASKKPLSMKQSPSIISVITEEEIRKSGARDILDVLRQVPGFDFGVDVQGAVGIGVRGNWAHEGKILLLLDGQEMNENLYGTLQFGNNYPISQIHKIEIIRGPGSAIYGGYAEYGVINIITKSGEEIQGVRANAVYGQMKDAYARRNISLSIGKKTKDLDVSLAGLIGQGNRSDQTYTDGYGTSYAMGNGDAILDPSYLNFGLKYKNLSSRFIIDNMMMNTRDGYDQVFSKAYESSFKGYFGELKYDLKINDKLTITPKVNFKRQIPWRSPYKIDSVDTFSQFDVVNDRYRANVLANYDFNSKINLIAGAEYFWDRAVDKITDSNNFAFKNLNSREASYGNTAIFSQILIKNNIANLTLGARYDKNSGFGDAFVPRVGLQKKVGLFNFKLLYSQSFRAPAIHNISRAISDSVDIAKVYNNEMVLQETPGSIKPEKSEIFEFEVGFHLNRNSYISASLFDITTKNAIIFFSDGASDFYYNKKETGTRGIELEYKWKSSWGQISLNYAFYTNGGKATVSDYRSLNLPSSNLGLAQHKFNINSNFNITKNLYLSPSLNFIGARDAVFSIVNDSTEISQKIDPVVLFNLFVNYDNLLIKGLSVGFGCYDILNQKVSYIQPYRSGHAPLPGTTREFTLRLSYNLDFKK